MVAATGQPSGPQCSYPSLDAGQRHRDTIIRWLPVTGPATITGNGKFPPPFGTASTLQIDVVGGNSVAFSNVKFTFGGDAAKHFGTQPVNGVIRSAK